MDHQQEVERDRLKSAVRRYREGETDWEALNYMMGRNERPALLQLVWTGLPSDQLVKALSDSWVMCEFPEQFMPRRKWLPIFRTVGYHDGASPDEPPEQMVLWRGGVKKTRMSWTASRERAEWFQHRFDHLGPPGKLWTVTVGPDRLLAHYHQDCREEDEYVIDPTELRPKVVTT
ncbi:hypothetical protein BHQ21_09595 [Mycobacterium sherrisii]|uniref:Uncharacterized protein n=1 Tax=Mycobacterium sherrisii TaxID=243061 RepID=A0A1E3SYV8_9MYCO|nr:hypothetical protein BHQ21_09595 [Mycobacterium sherrisii]